MTMAADRQFALGTFAANGGEAFPALVVGETVLDLRPRLGNATTTLGLLHDWERSFDMLAAAALDGDSAAHVLSDVRPLAPVMPRQILCAGANYHKHVREIVVATLRVEGDERSLEELHAEADIQLERRKSTEPYMFAGLPSALCGAHDDVVLWGPGRCHDWELELAVVVGRGGRDIDESQAMDHVAGYTISNDISVRDVQQRPRFPMTDFLMSKNRPTFFPTGPFIVPRQFVSDPRQLRIMLSVNGGTMQDESVDDIIYGVESLIAYASRIVGLEAGDIILTGSPAGNAGHHGDRWLRPGDVMEGAITGLGTQRNRCVTPPPS
jgi:2,4-didehydro-3-deoxy-L-rhamnonate hydrolase